MSPEIYNYLADGVFLVHFAFIVFVIFGGFLVFRWRWMSWVHLPAAVWGVAIVVGGWICPLTHLEVALRRAAGRDGPALGFIETYLIPIVYPEALTRELQLSLGVALLAFNVLVYFFALKRKGAAIP